MYFKEARLILTWY